jgi:cell division protein FtsQ
VWEEDAPSEPRFRRVQQSAPASGRSLPGMPLEVQDPDGEDPAGPRKRYGALSNPWWRPAGTLGRALLACGALVVASAFAISIHLCKSYLDHDSRFRITGTSNIQAVGLTEVNRAEMLPVFGEDIGRNVFFVPLAERRKQLEQIPWVQHATVMRLLPDQIRVSVVERQPVAFVRHGQQIGLVDANGVLLDMPVAAMAQHHYSFPVLTGIDVGDPLPSRKARMDVYSRLLGELDAGGQHLSDQVSEIDLTDPEDARVLMPEQGTDILAHFGEDHFIDRYQRYKAHIAEWRQQYPKLAAVDLRYDQQVVLEMTPGSATTQTAVNADDGKPTAVQPVVRAKTETAKPDASRRAVEGAKPSVAERATKPSGKTEIAKTELAKAETPKVDTPKLTAAMAPHVSVKQTTPQTATAQTTAEATPKTAAKTTQKPAPKTELAKANRPKSAPGSKAKKVDVSAHQTVAEKAKAARVKAMADKMRKKRADAKRAALNRSKQKPSAKPHTPTPAGQGQ